MTVEDPSTAVEATVIARYVGLFSYDATCTEDGYNTYACEVIARYVGLFSYDGKQTDTSSYSQTVHT